MKTFVTSDLHFDHKNIMTFCPRTRSRFSDVNHMNESMMEEWNDTASPEDLTFILGDIAFCNAEKAIAYLKRLTGDKILIKGNHDRKLLKDPGFRACFKEIHSDLTQTFNGVYVHMYHFPISEWDQMHRGSVHLHGHVHGGPSGLEKYRARDAGFDATGSVLVELDWIIQDALKGEIRGHH